MRRVAVILMVVLGAALLHTGAMAGFEAFASLASAHPAEHAHGAPEMPFCPAGSICPSMQTPDLALAAFTLLFAYAVFTAALGWLPRLALPSLAYAPFSPYAPPNHPKTLLSVFKRE